MAINTPNEKGSDALFKRMDAAERDIVLYMVHTSPPISIDDLVCLCGAPAVKILNVMETLRGKRFVHENPETGKGIYFFDAHRLAQMIQAYHPPQEWHQAIQKTIAFYTESLTEGHDKTLILAELYYRYHQGWEGAGYIKNGADLLYRSGQAEKALAYYNRLLENFEADKTAPHSTDFYLDGIIGKLSTANHLMPIPEKIAFLSSAEKLAKRHEKWEHLAKIKLSLGQELQATGQSKKALRYIKDFWRLAEQSGDPRMLKMATLLMSEYLHWKGKFSEVVQRYEEVVENLEEFGDDDATLKASARVGLCYVRCGRIARGMGMIEAVRNKAQLLNLQQVVIFTHLMSMLSLFEIRKLPEAEYYLNKILAYPREVVGHFILAPTFICKANIHCMREEYDAALDYLRRYLDDVHFIGWPHQNAAWNFEFLDAMEARGFICEEWNYDDEIKRMLGWDDIYMRGVSYRYRALRNLERRQPTGKVLADFKNSEKYLKKAGAELELARTRIAMGNLYLKRGDIKLSHGYLKKAWSLFAEVDNSLFPKDLLVSMPHEQKIDVMISRMIEINASLGSVRDMPAFLERVISTAMDFTMATRGAFFVEDPQGEPIIMASRNLDPLLLKADQFSFIRTAVSHAAGQNTEIILPEIQNTHGLKDQDLRKAGIYAMLCMPVKLGQQNHGYLYLDNCLGRKPFADKQLPFVRLVCSQIAVGLSNIKIYDEMKQTKNRFEEEATFYKKEMGIANPFETIIGHSSGIERVLSGIRQVAPTRSAVLITGETGVGKELVAKAIHNMSDRSSGPFIPVNLAALPADLVVSELFGHEKGAFTGANETSKGRFELANDGTIFLDEIGDLPPTIQVKLLRVLQEGTFERLGSAKPIQSNFRVIAATNKDLYTEVEKGLFRQDLFYRLNVFPIHVPPLRARKEDIAPLARHFIEKFSRQFGKRICRVPPVEMKKLADYHWPGNVRELKHLVERAVILYDGIEFTFSGFDHGKNEGRGVRQFPLMALADFEREYIEKVLEAVCWKLSGPNSASSILKLKPTTLLFRMKKLGIKKPSLERKLSGAR
jgi:transcriptional regulator with GAF, ATPase, and Fis domain